MRKPCQSFMLRMHPIIAPFSRHSSTCIFCLAAADISAMCYGLCRAMWNILYSTLLLLQRCCVSSPALLLQNFEQRNWENWCWLFNHVKRMVNPLTSVQYCGTRDIFVSNTCVIYDRGVQQNCMANGVSFKQYIIFQLLLHPYSDDCFFHDNLSQTCSWHPIHRPLPIVAKHDWFWQMGPHA